MMNHLLLFLLALPCLVASASDRPNILWISAEDISPHFGCYGDPHAITPNIDQLAAEGTRFTHAFTAAGVCAPCRSTIITGMWQTTIGTHHMRCNATLAPEVRPFPLYLREAGYFCTNALKTDYQFSTPSKAEIWDECGGKAHWRNRENPDQPFFAVFNFTGCHESGIAGEDKYKTVTADLTDAERQDPAALTTLPPYYPDTPTVREDWKRNYELITAMDHWAGGLLAQLEEDGLADNTIVMFWSDHGVGLPRAKRWLYDSGTHIPLVVRTPESFRQSKPGTVSSALVSSVDFAPTVLNLANIKIPSVIQGQPFLGDNLPPARDYVYGARDRMDERYEIIRSVRNHQYRYIRNYTPLKPYYQFMNTPEKGATMREIRTAEAKGKGKGNLTGALATFSAATKPTEELYDLSTDPHEINNLATDPAHTDKLAELRAAQQAWAAETRDIGLHPESEIELLGQDGSPTSDVTHTASRELPHEIVAAASLASSGSDALPELLDLTSHTNPTIRYWAANGIGNIGEPNKEAIVTTVPLLVDDFESVRIAAARALLRMNRPQQALPALEKALTSDLEWARLEAAIVLDEADETARPSLPALKNALIDQPNKYIIRVANKAVNDLEGTTNTVP